MLPLKINGSSNYMLPLPLFQISNMIPFLKINLPFIKIYVTIYQT